MASIRLHFRQKELKIIRLLDITANIVYFYKILAVLSQIVFLRLGTGCIGLFPKKTFYFMKEPVLHNCISPTFRLLKYRKSAFVFLSILGTVKRALGVGLPGSNQKTFISSQ